MIQRSLKITWISRASVVVALIFLWFWLDPPIFFIHLLEGSISQNVVFDQIEKHPEKANISLFGKGNLVVIEAEVVRKREDLIRGLSNRETLPEGAGMWFQFSSDGFWGIWMKEMRFPIDIIWVDEHFRIADIAEKISPDTYPKILYPLRAARFVLEVKSGVVEKSHLAVGDRVLVH